jgi:hypothetical protein
VICGLLEFRVLWFGCLRLGLTCSIPSIPQAVAIQLIWNFFFVGVNNLLSLRLDFPSAALSVLMCLNPLVDST